MVVVPVFTLIQRSSEDVDREVMKSRKKGEGEKLCSYHW